MNFLKKDPQGQPLPPDNVVGPDQNLEMDTLCAKEINAMIENGTATVKPRIDKNGKIIGQEVIDQKGQLLAFINLEEMEKAQKIVAEKMEEARKKDEHDRKLKRN